MTRPSRRAVVRTGVWTKPAAASTADDDRRPEPKALLMRDAENRLGLTPHALARMVRRDG
jgi:hypothetical protein